MLGAIIGDIVGSTREWHNVKKEDFELLPSGNHFTDDSVMTLAVAEWLMRDSKHQKDTLIECMQTLGRKYPNAGYGEMFRKWLASDNPKPYGSFGNGSAMRVSPVGMYANSLDEAMENALRLAISMGGDSDTIGCMTCAIANAEPFSMWGGGMPIEVEKRCRELLPPDLLDIHDRFEAFIRRP